MVTRRSRPTALGLRDQRRGAGDRRPLVLLVLRDVMFGSRRYSRIVQERSEEGIASNILAICSACLSRDRNFIPPDHHAAAGRRIAAHRTRVLTRVCELDFQELPRAAQFPPAADHMNA
jgi:hypothetical protein